MPISYFLLVGVVCCVDEAETIAADYMKRSLIFVASRLCVIEGLALSLTRSRGELNLKHEARLSTQSGLSSLRISLLYFLVL